MNLMNLSLLGMFRVLLLSPLLSGVAFSADVNSSSLLWQSLGLNYDFLADQQTGQPEGDIVGNATDYGFFTTFNAGSTATDGELGFRVRLDKAGGPPSKPAFDRVLWVGMDANMNGAIDAFLGVNFQGSNRELMIRDAGTEANTSPNTTSISNVASFSYIPTAFNYDYRMVNYLTDGGTTNDMTTTTSGDSDYYVSFMLPFADIVSFLITQGISVDSSTPVRYVMATSTQVNSLNQDLGGVNGGVNSSVTWEDLGGFSPVITPGGTIIPEPEAALLGGIGLLLLLRRRR